MSAAAVPDRPSGFPDDAARARYLEAHERALAELWPVPVRAQDVPTRRGTVRVYRAGDDGPDPLVLLAGAGGNAASWYRHVGALAAVRPVVAVDGLGEPGASVQREPIPDGAAVAGWVAEVLAAVGAQRAHLVGSSFGGWAALETARRQPERVGAVTLVDPAGFETVGRRFLRWVVLGGLASLLPGPLRTRAAAVLHNGTLHERELLRLGLAARRFRRRLPTPPVSTDEELRAVAAPVQVLLGEHSALHDTAAVAARLADVVPSWRVEVVPGTGHALPLEAVDLVVGRVLSFAPAAR